MLLMQIPGLQKCVSRVSDEMEVCRETGELVFTEVKQYGRCI